MFAWIFTATKLSILIFFKNKSVFPYDIYHCTERMLKDKDVQISHVWPAKRLVASKQNWLIYLLYFLNYEDQLSHQNCFCQ